jgi:hypothetical protein
MSLAEEALDSRGEFRLTPRFVDFFVKLLDEIETSLTLLSDFKKPDNPKILEEFQMFISQASVEPCAIKWRNQFLESAFRHYLNVGTKGDYRLQVIHWDSGWPPSSFAATLPVGTPFSRTVPFGPVLRAQYPRFERSTTRYY